MFRDSFFHVVRLDPRESHRDLRETRHDHERQHHHADCHFGSHHQIFPSETVRLSVLKVKIPFPLCSKLSFAVSQLFPTYRHRPHCQLIREFSSKLVQHWNQCQKGRWPPKFGDKSHLWRHTLSLLHPVNSTTFCIFCSVSFSWSAVVLASNIDAKRYCSADGSMFCTLIPLCTYTSLKIWKNY